MKEIKMIREEKKSNQFFLKMQKDFNNAFKKLIREQYKITDKKQAKKLLALCWFIYSEETSLQNLIG